MNSAPPGPAEIGDGAGSRPSTSACRALVPMPRPAAKAAPIGKLGRSHGVVAAGVAAVMGIGFVAGTAAFASKPQAIVTARAAPQAETTLDVIYRLQGEVRSLKASLDGLRASADDRSQSDSIRGLKRSVDVLKQDLEGVKAVSTGAVGQLGAKIDKLDRDPGPKLAEISARLDRLDREPDARISQVAAQLTARLDRVERQVASSDATGSIAPQAAAIAPPKPPIPPRTVQAAPVAPAAAPVAVMPPARPESAKAEPARAEPAKPEVVAKADAAPQPRPQEAPAKPATVDGWLLRDVYGGVALVEGRVGGLQEVAPGEYVPGVGEIRAIERRGRGWVVVTSRGLIQADNRR